MESSQGKTLGKYEIGRTLGTGATGKVKLGYDPSTGKQVAIKILHQHLP